MSPNMDEISCNYELLRTIRLNKNLYKLQLPEATYSENQNYQTVPAPNIYSTRKKSQAKMYDEKQNAQSLP